VRHGGLLEGELDAGERAQQHRLVEVAHVPDAKDLALQRREPAPQRDAVAADRVRAIANDRYGISTAVSESDAASGSSE